MKKPKKRKRTTPDVVMRNYEIDEVVIDATDSDWQMIEEAAKVLNLTLDKFILHASLGVASVVLAAPDE